MFRASSHSSTRVMLPVPTDLWKISLFPRFSAVRNPTPKRSTESSLSIIHYFNNEMSSKLTGVVASISTDFIDHNTAGEMVTSNQCQGHSDSFTLRELLRPETKKKDKVKGKVSNTWW